MRLLSVNTDGSFSVTSFAGNNIPSYAILSHTWETDYQEVTFQDICNVTGSSKKGYRKIQFCGKQAKKDGLQYFWVDSCCINKSSSSEQQEAINSMFRWYRDAAKCYVYLTDVSKHDLDLITWSAPLPYESAIRDSRWFTRGWTLQELLAPRTVDFFNKEGMLLGNRASLRLLIHEITGIALPALQGDPLHQFSVDERMSWAEKRQTTIEEDKVYSLLGIFDIYLPLIYGEGMTHAFLRLQEQINKRSSTKSVDKDQMQRKKVQWSQEELKCARALRTSEYEQFKDRNPDRLEGTCEWFLQHENYHKWRQSSSSGLLWVSADPGCGKSVLSKSLIDQEIKATESQTTCYFFFKDDNDKQKSIPTALSALLHQLFSQRKSLIQYALQDYQSEGDKLPQSFHKLWGILTRATSDPKAGQVICILDALDECAESGRYQIIDALKKFYKQANSGQSVSQLKFFVTSRPYLDIERRFMDLIRNVPTIRLHGEKESEAISREIDIVIKWKVDNLGLELELDDREQSTLESELLSIQHRTYLWLKLIFEVIQHEISLTRTRLKRIIRTLPVTVDQAYEAILSKSKDQIRARKLLHIVVAATRPLTLKEMNVALAIEDHHKSYDNLDLEKEATFGSSVRNLCGLFVTVVDQKIYLIHQTAKEFLIAKDRPLTGQWKHSLDPVESDLIVARACIIYLNFDMFEEESVSEEESDHQVTKENDFYGYAAGFWTTHFRQVQSRATGELSQSVLRICDAQSSRFRRWFSEYYPTYCPYIEPDEELPSFTSTLMVEAFLGHKIMVQLLLETGQADINSKNDLDLTALGWAARNGHKAVVRLLLQTGQVDVDSEDCCGQTPLSQAAERRHEAVVKLLLKMGRADVNLKDHLGWTPLWHAALNGHEAIFKLLLRTDQADLHSKDDEGRTLLSLAVMRGHEGMVELLLATGRVDVDSKDDNGQTPLLLATEEGHEAVVKLLLATGQVDVDSKDGYGRTPLLLAAENGEEAIVKLLLDSGNIELSSKDKYGQTALSFAARGKGMPQAYCRPKAWSGRGAVVELLLATGQVDVDLKDDRGRTPLSLAAEDGHKAVVKLLLATSQVNVDSKDDDGWTPLSLAAQNGHEAVVKLLLDTGTVRVNLEDNSGRTPLSLAAQNGHKAVVKLLLDSDNVKVNFKDNRGQAPFSLAAQKGHEAIVKLLLNSGNIEVNLKDNYGWTPLSFTAWNGHEAIVKLLLNLSNIEVDSKDSYGQTPLSLAAQNGHEAIVKLLLNLGNIEVDSKDSYGQTPLSLAAQNGHETIVKLLLDSGNIEVDSKDGYGWTPLSLAAQNGHGAIVKLLLDSGNVKVDSKATIYSRTPLSLAAQNGHEAVVKLLLNSGNIEVDSKDSYGRTPLSLAAQNGHEAVVKLLLDSGNIEIDSKVTIYSGIPLIVRVQNQHEDVDKPLLDSSRTPLSLAAQNGHEAVVKLLLATGQADVESKDNRGMTPLSLAAQNGHEAVVKLLHSFNHISMSSSSPPTTFTYPRSYWLKVKSLDGQNWSRVGVS